MLSLQWNLMRFVRAGLAGWAFWEAFRTGEWLLLIPGAILGMQAVFNVGCCGSGGCAAPMQPTDKDAGQETVVYEEVR